MPIYEHDNFRKGKDARGDRVYFAHDDRAKKHARPNAKALQAKVEDWNRRVKYAKPRYRQVLHLIEKFGGIVPFSMAVGTHPDRILYHWLGVSKKYTQHRRQRDGLLSYGFLMRAVQFSRHFGVLLKPEDLFPDFIQDGLIKPINTVEMAEWMASIEKSKKVSMKALEDDIASLVLTQD